MDSKLLGDFNKCGESISGLRASGSGYKEEKIIIDEIENMKVELKDLHSSIDIKEDNRISEYQQDSKEEFIMESHPSTTRRVRPNDHDFDDTVMEWFEDCNVASDIDSDCDAIESDHESDSIEKQSEDDAEDIEIVNIKAEDSEFSDECESERDQTKFFGKNKFLWTAKPNTIKRKTQKHNITDRPGLLGPANVRSATPEEMWNLLIDNNILSEILRWTNLRIEKHKIKYKKKDHSVLKELDIIELKAFIGLLYFSAAFKSNREDVNALFATDGTGRDIFRAVMTKVRFLFLLSVLRFDDPDKRNERKKLDPSAPISFIFDSFVKNCQELYSIGECATIDEMLVSFRGRCKFRKYIPNKPCKYGIKIMTLADSKTHYFLNGYIYVGKDSDELILSQEEQELSKPTQSVIRLSKPIFGSNRNITANNRFTSIDLVHLLTKRGLTYVGTLNRNKNEIPAEFLLNKTESTESSLYGFTTDITFVSYVSKEQKVYSLVSSMHHSKCTDLITNQPEILMFYNSTKGGVNALDEKCVLYCTGRRTRRWPMAVFFRILDISSVNAYVLYSTCKDNLTVKRLDFIKKLSFQLVKPEMERRLLDERRRTTQEIRFIIGRILNISPITITLQDDRGKLLKRKNCSFCPVKKDRKASRCCIICRKPICLQCSRHICEECL